jgi:hypothetical protein
MPADPGPFQFAVNQTVRVRKPEGLPNQPETVIICCCCKGKHHNVYLARGKNGQRYALLEDEVIAA